MSSLHKWFGCWPFWKQWGHYWPGLDKVRVLHVCAKRGYEHCFPWTVAPLKFDTVFISEEQGSDYRALYDRFYEPRTRGVVTCFAIIPNGMFLPVPLSHYKP